MAIALPLLAGPSVSGSGSATWWRPAGWRTPFTRELGAVLALGLPLALASSGHAVRLFLDHLMLAWHSAESVSASLPGGLTSFLLLSLVGGCAGHSQMQASAHLGAGEAQRVGACIWQGLWIALIGGALLAPMSFLCPGFFALLGHAPGLAAAEGRYCGILLLGSVFSLWTGVLAGFWIARDRTSVVLLVTLLMAVVNGVGNWALIFGNLGCPALGIDGAAWATILSEIVGSGVFLALFLAREHRLRFGTWPRRTLEAALAWRLVRIGLPEGVRAAVDVAAFNAFVLAMAAHPDPSVAEAGALTLGVGDVAALPLAGFAQAGGSRVARAVGAGDPAAARRAASAAALIVLGYGAVVVAGALLAPGQLLACFARADDPAQAQALSLASGLLILTAIWLIGDGLNQVFAQALQGAEDTAWTMAAGTGLAWGVLVPAAAVAWWCAAPGWVLWSILAGHVMLGAGCFLARWQGGRWQSEVRSPESEVRGLETSDGVETTALVVLKEMEPPVVIRRLRTSDSGLRTDEWRPQPAGGILVRWISPLDPSASASPAGPARPGRADLDACHRHHAHPSDWSCRHLGSEGGRARPRAGRPLFDAGGRSAPVAPARPLRDPGRSVDGPRSGLGQWGPGEWRPGAVLPGPAPGGYGGLRAVPAGGGAGAGGWSAGSGGRPA